MKKIFLVVCLMSSAAFANDRYMQVRCVYPVNALLASQFRGSLQILSTQSYDNELHQKLQGHLTVSLAKYTQNHPFTPVVSDLQVAVSGERRTTSDGRDLLELVVNGDAVRAPLTPDYFVIDFTDRTLSHAHLNNGQFAPAKCRPDYDPTSEFYKQHILQ